MTDRFTITYDYLCPFAQIANETLVEALDDGADYEPTFAPFSLHQNSLDGTEPAVWDRDPSYALGSGVRALLWSLVVRDNMPDAFLRFHMGLFSVRHDDGADLNDPDVLSAVAASVGLDPELIIEHVATGVPAATLAREHTSLVEDFGVFGVPTFISGDDAVFVRFMERHRRDDLERVVDMLGWANLNEFKRTRIPR
jgi:hypothetical protein